jgi:hypothetical protein
VSDAASLRRLNLALSAADARLTTMKSLLDSSFRYPTPGLHRSEIEELLRSARDNVDEAQLELTRLSTTLRKITTG